MLWLLSGPKRLTCLIFFVPVLCLCTVESLSLLYLLFYLDLYVLGDDAWFHATKLTVRLVP